MDITAVWLGLATGLGGALIGGLLTIVNTTVINRFETKRNEEKAKSEEQGNILKNIRTQVAEVGREMLSMQHSMEWICWHGAHAPQLIDDHVISQYENEVHTIYPRLLGALCVLASMDLSLYNELLLLSKELYALDGGIARAVAVYRDSSAEAARILKEHYPSVVDLYEKLPERIGGIMQARQKPEQLTTPAKSVND